MVMRRHVWSPIPSATGMRPGPPRTTPRTYIYPCSVCKTEYEWLEQPTAAGATCPSCRDNMMSELIALGEEQEDSEKQLHARMAAWWDDLPEDVQEKAFFCVVKKLVDSELRNDRSYRQILHEDFGFDKRAYYMGITCGFMELHNSIVPQDQLSKMRSALATEERVENLAKERFTIKSRCDCCGYQSMDIYPEQAAGCPLSDCDGYMIAAY